MICFTFCMHTTCSLSQDFIQSLLSLAEMRLSVSSSWLQDNCLLQISGEDSGMLLSTGGELLDALEHIVNKAFIQHLPPLTRIVCDVNNYRLNRETELQSMARHALEQVNKTHLPFIFAPMNANERRVIHKTLADIPTVSTESVGEGNARHLKISLRR